MPSRRILPLLLLVLGAAFPLQAEYFVIRDYRVTVQFTEKGYADFTEEITVEFTEPRHGIFRNIPLASDIRGVRVSRLIRDVSVEGFQYSESTEGNDHVIKIGDPDIYVEGRQVYRIRYRILDPLNFYETHSEFYWDLLGAGWDVPVEAFYFEVQFPQRIALTQDDVRIFTGPRGSVGRDASLEASGNSVRGTTIRPFEPYEAVTLAVRLPADAFEQMDLGESLWLRFRLLLVPIAFLLAIFTALFRERNQRMAVMTEYFPPEGISPAVAGGFVDHSVDNDDIVCLIPLLADKGYLRLESEEGGFLSRDKIYFVKLKDAPGPDLLPFEAAFFNALFSYGDRVDLSSLKDRFYVHISSIRKEVKEWIDAQDWYDPGRKRWVIYTVVAGIALVVWGFIALFTGNGQGFVLIITGVGIFFLTMFFRKRSPAGNETFRRLEGFRQFVKKAERPVIERLLQEDPHYYDKTMPYALAFGYLKRWNRQFDGLLSEPPQWYRSGMHHGNMSDWSNFSDSFRSEIDQIDSVFTSSPSSSGSSGGGSSGGGSGGGGGGSW